MASDPTERRLAAIMFTDIVGYTALMAESEEKGLRVRERHRELVRSLVERYHGEWREETGDECLSTFASAVDAVNCALALQAEVDDELQLRIGIHLGEILVQEGRLYGDGVNVASRIRPLAEPGGVCVSGEVHRSIRNQPGIDLTSLGERELKNVPEPVAVYSVAGTAAPPRPFAKVSPEARRRVPPPLPWAVALLVVIALSVGWWIYRPLAASAPIRSIAVLPLQNLSGDPEQEYFADGLTEEITNALVKVPGLRVAARTSAFAFKDRNEDVRTIGRQLNVDGVVEGSVRRSRDRLRITAQLIRTEDGFHLWSNAYDRELEDVFAIQSEIAAAVVGALRVELGGVRSLVEPPTADLDAYHEYLRGRHHLYTYTPADTRRAIQYFERALARDPDFALANTGLATAYTLWRGFGLFSAQESRASAWKAASRALESAPELAEAHAAMGFVQLIHEWDFAAAERSYLRGIELNPGLTDPHLGYALSLEFRGRHAEAVVEMERLQELDPLSPMVQTNWAAHLYFVRRFEEAAAALANILESQPTYQFARLMLARVYTQQQRYDEAAAELQSWLAQRGQPAQYGGAFTVPPEGLLGYVYAMAGRRAEALPFLEELQGRSVPGSNWPLGVAIIYMGLGEIDHAFEWLNRSVEGHSADLWAKVDPLYDPLRSDPRFQDLLRRVGFPES